MLNNDDFVTDDFFSVDHQGDYTISETPRDYFLNILLFDYIFFLISHPSVYLSDIYKDNFYVNISCSLTAQTTVCGK